MDCLSLKLLTSQVDRAEPKSSIDPIPRLQEKLHLSSLKKLKPSTEEKDHDKYCNNFLYAHHTDNSMIALALKLDNTWN